MADTLEKYHREDKNQAKIDALAASLTAKINAWLEGRPTGQLVLSAEINASQGGLSKIYMEQKERERL